MGSHLCQNIDQKKPRFVWYVYSNDWGYLVTGWRYNDWGYLVKNEYSEQDEGMYAKGI